MKDNGILCKISWILVIFGGLNWLLFGLIYLDIVAMIFGQSIIARLIYILIGLSACYLIYQKFGKGSAEKSE